MHPELPAFSFICATFLTILLPLHYRRISIAHVSVISWLLICNIIQAVNSIVWAHSAVTVIPVWCDIVTKLILGVNVALPAALICICRHLELLSSSRKISCDPNYNRRRTMTELTLCIVLPVIYVLLHTIVQDHRFDIIENFGCKASIYSSITSIILIRTPPLILSIIALVYSALALSHFFQHRDIFSQHLETRTHLTPFDFGRFLSTCVIQLCLLSSLFIFTISSEVFSGLRQWASWKTVHQDFSHIPQIDLSAVPAFEQANVAFSWWAIIALSFVCIGGFAVGCMKDASLPTHEWLYKRQKTPEHAESESFFDSSDLPRRAKYPIIISSSPLTPIVIKPEWNDTINSRASEEKVPTSEHTDAAKLSDACPPPSSPEDDAFMASTMHYLRSSTARQVFHLPKAPAPALASTSRSNRESVMSAASSLFNSQWPLPPSSIPSSPLPPARTPSPSPSTATNGSHAFGYPLYPSITPPDPLQDRPFNLNGPSVSPIESDVSPVRPFKQIRRQRSLRDLTGENRRNKLSPADVIYMTVVKETV